MAKILWSRYTLIGDPSPFAIICCEHKASYKNYQWRNIPLKANLCPQKKSIGQPSHLSHLIRCYSVNINSQRYVLIVHAFNHFESRKTFTWPQVYSCVIHRIGVESYEVQLKPIAPALSPPAEGLSVLTCSSQRLRLDALPQCRPFPEASGWISTCSTRMPRIGGLRGRLNRWFLREARELERKRLSDTDRESQR